MKILITVNTILVALVLGLAGSAVQAGSGCGAWMCGDNGSSLNGVWENGVQPNGIQGNGASWNGQNLNGTSVQGTAVSGLRPFNETARVTVTTIVLPSGESVELRLP